MWSEAMWSPRRSVLRIHLISTVLPGDACARYARGTTGVYRCQRKIAFSRARARRNSRTSAKSKRNRAREVHTALMFLPVFRRILSTNFAVTRLSGEAATEISSSRSAELPRTVRWLRYLKRAPSVALSLYPHSLLLPSRRIKKYPLPTCFD